jgi:hypothetical protein
LKTFVSSKNIFSCSILWIIAIGLLIILFIEKPEAETLPLFIFNLIIIGIISMLIWILFDTKYSIKEEILYFYSGPFRGKININSIRKIEHHSGLIVPVTYKPALDTKGLIIYYNSFDDIYISPNQKEIFIQELLKTNPNIKVVN